MGSHLTAMGRHLPLTVSRATVSAVSCLVVPAFICTDLLISRVLKINDDDDDMGSHSVTCHPTKVNVPRLNSSQ